jgi:hypothetical protein
METYRRLFGGHSWISGKTKSKSYLPYTAAGFFANGGKRCFISRILGNGNKTATLQLASESESPTEEPPDEPPEEGEAGESTAGKGRSARKRRSSRQGSVQPILEVRAVGPGAWGNRIGVAIGSGSSSPSRFKLKIYYWRQSPPSPIVDPDDPSREKDPNRRVPAAGEEFDNLSSDPASPDFYERRINNQSTLIEVQQLSAGNPPASTEIRLLEGGDDGSEPVLGDYLGDAAAEPGERTGLDALREVDEISMVCIPNEHDAEGLSDAIVTHCERMKDRFAILQAKQNAGPVADLRPPVDSKYAAFYFPWIQVIDPLTGMPKLVPPGGHIAGIYARNDTERGVHKAPANEIVRGAADLQLPVGKGVQDVLNPRGVNCLRSFVSRGIRVWGARTTSSDPLWKYVNVRRLFLFLEESIEESTQWVVFEPNNRRLWARVRQSVSDFLTRVWKDGALMGATAEEAFFVRCDETTMTPGDIETGRLIVVIGVAPARPAEFVIFRIAQWRGGSATTE